MPGDETIDVNARALDVPEGKDRIDGGLGRGVLDGFGRRGKQVIDVDGNRFPKIPDPPTFPLIRAKYDEVMGMFALGAFIGPDEPTRDGRGRVQEFEHGTIIWHPATGAHMLDGPIRTRWEELGRDAFGYPTTDVLTSPDHHGKLVHLKQLHLPGAPEVSIYWSAATGAHEVVGAIRGFWASTGWETGELGYPLEAEHGRDGGVAGAQQAFQGGVVVWTVREGAAILAPPIQIDQPSIVFGGGVPVGGDAHLSLFPDGRYVYKGHFHDSGGTSYDVAHVILVRTDSGTVLQFANDGRVHGTFEPGSRDHDWEVGGRNDELAAVWPGLSRHYTWTARSGANVNLSGLVDEVKQGIGFVKDVIVVVAAF